MSRRWSRSVRAPLAAVAVILAILVGQVAGARAALCPTRGAHAAPCRCCAKPPAAKRELARDAKLAARCCAIEAGAVVGAVPEPMVRGAEATPAIAPGAVLSAALAPTTMIAPPAAVVIARASGPPIWLTTRSLRL